MIVMASGGGNLLFLNFVVFRELVFLVGFVLNFGRLFGEL